MTIEGQENRPTPKGYEYKRIPGLGKQVLLPERGEQPLREGTDLTEAQYQVSRELLRIVDKTVYSYRPRFLEKREGAIFSEVILKDQNID